MADPLNKQAPPDPGSLFDDPLLTVTQVARLLRVTPRTVTSWCEKGRLEHTTTPGGHRRIPMSVIIPYVRATNGLQMLGDNGT